MNAVEFEDLGERYNVIIMSGIPGSGKSYLAQKYLKNKFFCSADYYFLDDEGNYNFDASEIGNAHKFCMRLFLESVQGNHNVVVDNTGIEAWEISPYIAVAEAYNLKVCVLQVNCEPDKAITRNQHKVPERTINRMANRLQARRLPSHWKVITVEN